MSAQGTRQLMRQAEPQSVTIGVLLAAVKSFKYVRQIFGIDAWTAIGDSDDHSCFEEFDGEVNGRSIGAVLDRIVQQHRNHLSDCWPVHGHRQVVGGVQRHPLLAWPGIDQIVG